MLTPTGSWKICYYVYLTDPIMKQEKRHHRRRVIGHKSSMRKVDAEQILRQELDLAAAKPSSRPADHTITFGEWMRTAYIPMRGTNWRPATRRTNEDYLKFHLAPVFGQVQLKDITKFSVQMFLNRMAQDGYSYRVVYHVSDLIKACLAKQSIRK